MTETNRLRIEILLDERLLFSESLDFPLEIGRQRIGEVEPIAINRETNPQRLIIASNRDREVSRDHARIEQIGAGIRINNISSKSEILICDIAPTGASQNLEAGQSQNISLPASFIIGSCHFRIQAIDAQIVGLEQVTMPPSMIGRSLDQTLASPALQEFRSPDQMDVPELMNWLRNVLDLFQASPGTDDFFRQSTAVIAQMLKLDSAAILFRASTGWEVRHLYQRGKSNLADEWRPSLTILNEVENNVRAFRQIPKFDADRPQSLLGVSSLVAAPILSIDGVVIGALYGDKRAGQSPVAEISEVETMFVELLASGIASGLARQEKEKQIVQARVRFEQFFPATLVDKLEKDQDFLKGKESEVTVMFCDIRRFSQIAERVGPKVTVDFIGDALQQLSLCVLKNDGVLVDYIADELIAMWGAPEAQPEHATMAVRAAQDMMKCVPDLNRRWASKIGTEFQIGIGLNTGIAKVGNIGSKVRFKYGPIGNAVNIASRVQGVTKKFKTPFMITAETAAKLGPEVAFRKLCRVKLVNVMQPVMVCEVPTEPDENWEALKAAYEEGLELFEQKSFLEACDRLARTLNTFPDDTPTKKLLARAVNQISDENPGDDSTVWVLDSK